MTITTQDIKFFASKVMSDVPEGGGGPSAVVLQSGKSNNIFRDVREQDRAGGNLSMRQVHLGITSGNTDVAMGANIIVSEPPSVRVLPTVADTIRAPGLPLTRFASSPTTMLPAKLLLPDWLRSAPWGALRPVPEMTPRPRRCSGSAVE